MSLPLLLAATLGLLLLATFALWALSVRLRDASVIDPFWGTGFVLVAWTSLALVRSPRPRAILLATLVTIWGLRLSVHLLRRRRGQGEDRRYAAMRNKAGDRFPRTSLFTVFWLQAVILWFVSWPLQIAVQRGGTDSFGWLDALGGGLWVVGFLFESIGDWQLARFNSDPANRGRVLDRGLWRYTRHPNYFGDFCVWWGCYLISAAGGAWAAILSPLAMSALLIRFSGVGPLEGTIAERRPEYREYQRRTNAFFPWPSRRVRPRGGP
jgi:steroid 5-alpha reductase family enzyme